MIDSKQVVELRKISNCGVMDCKIALEKTNGNIDEAIILLRNNGARKVQDRDSKFGNYIFKIYYSSEDKKASGFSQHSCTKEATLSEIVKMVKRSVSFQICIDDYSLTKK